MTKVKTQNRLKALFSISKRATYGVGATFIAVVIAVSGITFVHAQSLQDQINALDSQNAQKQGQLSSLSDQASSYQDLISKLQAQISSLQKQINQKQSQIQDLQKQIEQAQKELDKQRNLLGENIRAMYVEGDVSTLEMLASSQNLSDFVDKQQYRNAVKDKITDTLDKINELKHQLSGKKDQVQKVLTDQKNIQAQLASQKGEQSRLLGLNESQQDKLNSQIQNNSSKIAELRRQQAIENAKHSSSGQLVKAGSCGGGYPDVWCRAPQDSLVDNWGMYNRECVSYTAYRVYASGRYMPYWGGRGNANQWDDNARAAGIPVDTHPRAGDVAIAHWGYYGHAMYVESVNANGTINVSQYNWGWDGSYSMMYNFSTSGLVFIHFR